jgi:hypothetical protein
MTANPSAIAAAARMLTPSTAACCSCGCMPRFLHTFCRRWPLPQGAEPQCTAGGCGARGEPRAVRRQAGLPPDPGHRRRLRAKGGQLSLMIFDRRCSYRKGAVAGLQGGQLTRRGYHQIQGIGAGFVPKVGRCYCIFYWRYTHGKGAVAGLQGG